jgi:hypothetical protein
MMASGIYSRALQRAAELLGGPDKLAAYLGVSTAEAQKWIAGTRPPQAVFLRVVDFIIDETSPPQSDAADPPARNDCASPDDRRC